MKALITGGGSKFGLKLSKLLVQDYKVDLITGQDQTSLPDNLFSNITYVDWNNTDLLKNELNISTDYDLVIFNHNPQGEYGELVNLVNTTFTASVLDRINPKPDLKVMWMISGLVNGEMPQYNSYASRKATWIYMMRQYASKQEGIYFGLEPGHIIGGEEVDVFDQIKKANKQYNKKVITKNGQERIFTL